MRAELEKLVKEWRKKAKAYLEALNEPDECTSMGGNYDEAMRQEGNRLKYHLLCDHANSLQAILDKHEERAQCDWRGMACPKGEGCQLPEGHEGPHKFKDDGVEWGRPIKLKPQLEARSARPSDTSGDEHEDLRR